MAFRRTLLSMNISGVLLLSHAVAAILGSTVTWFIIEGTSEDVSKPPSAASVGASEQERGRLRQDSNRNVYTFVRPTKDFGHAPESYAPYDRYLDQHIDSNATRDSEPFAGKVQRQVEELARKHPRSALLWLFSDDKDSVRFRRAHPFERGETIRIIFESMAPVDVQDCLALVSTFDDPAVTGQALLALLDRRPQLMTPMQMLGDLSVYAPSEMTAREVEKVVLQGWARFDSDAAKSWVLGNQSGDALQESILAVAEGEMSIRPESSIEWGETHSDGPHRQNTLEYLFDIWSSRDPKAAGEWLQRRPDDPTIHNTIRNFALRLHTEDPLYFDIWLSGIQDESLSYVAIDALRGNEPRM